jgi:hypothetical protein
MVKIKHDKLSLSFLSVGNGVNVQMVIHFHENLINLCWGENWQIDPETHYDNIKFHRYFDIDTLHFLN